MEPRGWLVTMILKSSGDAARSASRVCCGSAGTYNMLQPIIARRLAERKAANIAKIAPDVIAAGNLGCMTQLELVTDIPIVHTVELLDWATGGPQPQALQRSRKQKG